MYGAVEGAALSAVPSDGERLCCPMIDLRTEADLLRRWPAAGPGAGAAIAKAAATGERFRCYVRGGGENGCSETCTGYGKDMSGIFGGAVGVVTPDGSCLIT